MAEVDLGDDKSGNIRVQVCEPQKIGEGLTAYVQYKVVTHDASSRVTASLYRRFSDFFNLFQYLVKLYVPQGYIVVKPPERSVVAMTRLKLLDPIASDNHVHERMYRLSTFINSIVSHKVIGQDEGVTFFLNEDNWESKLKVNPKKGAIDDFIDKLEEIFPINLNLDNFDEWFSKTMLENHALYAKLEKLRDSLTQLQYDRVGLSSDLQLLSTACTNMCFSESHGNLAKVFNKYATLLENLSEFRGVQSKLDLKYLVTQTKDTLAWLRGASLVYKKAILNCLEIDVQNKALVKKQEALQKEERAASARRIGEIKSQIVGIEAVITALKESQKILLSNFQLELKNLLVSERARKTKAKYVEYLQETLSIEQKVLTLWEEFLPICQEFSSSG